MTDCLVTWHAQLDSSRATTSFLNFRIWCSISKTDVHLKRRFPTIEFIVFVFARARAIFSFLTVSVIPAKCYQCLFLFLRLWCASSEQATALLLHLIGPSLVSCSTTLSSFSLHKGDSSQSQISPSFLELNRRSPLLWFGSTKQRKLYHLCSHVSQRLRPQLSLFLLKVGSW